jgi:hypothetical protein
MDKIPPLRTGLAVPDEPKTLTSTQSRMMAMVLLLVKKAATTAAIYCRHQGIQEVDVSRIRRALKYESIEFFDAESLETETDAITKQIEAWDASMLTDRGTSPETIETVIDKLVDHVEESTQDEQAREACQCALCTAMQDIDERWAAYHPEDEAKKFLKDQMTYIDSLYEQEETIL